MQIEELFYGKTGRGLPIDTNGNGVKEIRNILAQNTQCSSRSDGEYTKTVSIWNRLLIEINSDKHYIHELNNAARYLLDVDEEDTV